MSAITPTLPPIYPGTTPLPIVREWPQREGRPALRYEASCCLLLLDFRMWRTNFRARVALAHHLAAEHAVTIAPARLLVTFSAPCTVCERSVLASPSCHECGGFGFTLSPPEPVPA